MAVARTSFVLALISACFASAQAAPSPKAPYRYGAVPIVAPGYSTNFSPPLAPVVGGGSVAGLLVAPGGRLVPFQWTESGGFVDLAAALDAVLPNPFAQVFVFAMNDSGLSTGTVSYVNGGGAVEVSVFILDTSTQTFTLHGPGGGYSINAAGDVLVISSAGYELLRNGTRTNYAPFLLPGAGLALTLLDDGDILGVDWAWTRVMRWSPGGSEVEVTPPGLGALTHTVANATGDFLVWSGRFTYLADASGSILQSFPEELAMSSGLADDRTVMNSGVRSERTLTTWNGHMVPVFSSLESSSLDRMILSRSDRQGNFVSFGIGARWNGVPVIGSYHERLSSVAPAIALRRSPQFGFGTYVPQQVFRTNIDFDLHFDVYGGEVGAPAAVVIAPPGTAPFVIGAGVLSADVHFRLSVPIARDVSMPGIEFQALGVTVMSSATIELGVSLPRMFEILD